MDWSARFGLIGCLVLIAWLAFLCIGLEDRIKKLEVKSYEATLRNI